MLLEKKDFEMMNISRLPEEKKEVILSLKDNLQLNHESIIAYGEEPSQKLTDFSSELLRSVKLKDNPEAEELLGSLMENLKTIDTDKLVEKKPGFLARLLHINNVQEMINKYSSIEEVISQVSKQLESAKYQLRKNVNICNTFLQENSEYIEELDMHIVAAKMRSADEHKKLDEKRATIDSDDVLAVQELSIYESEINRLDRKIHDMLLQRQIAIQNIPQIMLIRDGDSSLIEEITTGINTAIPLWQRQFSISIQAMQQKQGVKLEKSVKDTTNALLNNNAKLIKENSLDVAREIERDFVDAETLKRSNDALIETISEIRKIRADGVKYRTQVEAELIQQQQKLNAIMIEQK